MILYIALILLFATGLIGMISLDNLVKKLLALSIFQVAILLFYLSLAKVKNALPPILLCAQVENCPAIYANPLPQVLMLTAIVVGVATLAVGLALLLKVKTNYGSINYRTLITKLHQEQESE